MARGSGNELRMVSKGAGNERLGLAGPGTQIGV